MRGLVHARVLVLACVLVFLLVNVIVHLLVCVVGWRGVTSACEKAFDIEVRLVFSKRIRHRNARLLPTSPPVEELWQH